jgi:N-acetylglucosaminyl-diphospho-decaprenol L-rhamnosyltransferase
MIRSKCSLLVVIVNYRTSGLVIDTIKSLESEVTALPGLCVVVVDNASGDGSADLLRDAVREHGWLDWVSVLPLEHNGGFAAGNNSAIRPALQSDSPPRYVFLLNPDTVVRSGAVRTLFDFMEDRPDVGLAGSRLEDPDGTPQRSAFRFPTVLGELECSLRLRLATRLLARWAVARPVSDDAGPTDWVAGASLIVRREVFDAIGLLDEGYFLYYEEVDFCRRASLAGWPCWYVPQSHVVHLVGQSSGLNESDDNRRRRRPAYWFEARRRYLLTHLGRTRTILSDLAWSVGYLTNRTRRFILRKPNCDPESFLQDFLRHSLQVRSKMVKQ